MLNRRLSLLIAVLALLVPRLKAATFDVNNTADSGSNSLRDAISSATVGVNTVAWAAGSGGQIDLETELAIADSTTLDVSAAPSSVTIAGSSLNLGGGAAFLNTSVAQPWTISSTIVGVGSMTKTGAGTLILTGSNSYSAGTFLNAGKLNIDNSSALGSGALTIDGGTLQTASTITFSNAITLAAGGGTIDTLGNGSVLSGVIDGAGSLTNVSTGILTLTGVNTYAGGTFLSSGVLNVNGDAALGAASGGLTFNGGTLQLASDMSTARAITLTGGGAFDTNGKNLALSGVVGGAGGLTKLGPGILTLSAANAYGGATTVAAGTLRLGIDDALPATTALSLAPGAALDLSVYRSTVASFTSDGGTLKSTILGANSSSRLIVTGARSITGGSLIVGIAPGVLVAAGSTFTVVASGSNAGPDSWTIVSPAALSFTPAYSAGGVLLTASFVPFADSAANSNQGAIAASLEPMRVNITGDSAAVLSSLYSLDAPQLRAALDQLSPVSLASMQGVGLAASGVHAAAVGQRIAVLADGASHPGFASYNVSGRSSYPGALVAETLGDDNMSVPLAAGVGSSPWGYFASLSGATGRLTEGTGPSGTQPGYAFNSGGLTAGVDYRFDEHSTAGASLGYLKGHASIYAPGSGTVDDDSVRFGGYGAADFGNFRSNAYLGGALDFFKTRRGIVFPGVSRVAEGSTLGTELDANANVSYDLPTAQYGTCSPFGGLTYDRLMMGSFTETGADTLNLAVAPQTAQSLQSTLGLRLSQKWESAARTYTPYLSLGWRHEFLDQSRPITARFATGVGEPFTVSTGRYARDGTAVGLGFAAALARDVTAKLDYAGDFRSHFVSTTVTAELRLRF